MIKIGQEGPQGWVVILGLSRENLRLALEEAQPIAFPASQVGLGPGRLGLGTRGSREALEEVLGEPLAGFLELTEDVARTLVSGQVYTTDLESLGFQKAGDLALLAGEDEDHIVDAFRAAGLVSEDTRIVDESSGVEAPRKPTVAAASPLAAFLPLGHRPERPDDGGGARAHGRGPGQEPGRCRARRGRGVHPVGASRAQERRLTGDKSRTGPCKLHEPVDLGRGPRKLRRLRRPSSGSR